MSSYLNNTSTKGVANTKTLSKLDLFEKCRLFIDEQCVLRSRKSQHKSTELRKLTAVVENDCFYCEKQEKWQRLEQEYTELNTNFLLHKELNFFFH